MWCGVVYTVVQDLGRGKLVGGGLSARSTSRVPCLDLDKVGNQIVAEPIESKTGDEQMD